MMTVDKEVLYPVTVGIALDCIAASIKGAGYADIAKPDGTGFAPSTSMAIVRLTRLLNMADDLICICDDKKLPGYSVAFYDRKFGRWLRVKTNPAKIKQYAQALSPRGGQSRDAASTQKGGAVA